MWACILPDELHLPGVDVPRLFANTARELLVTFFYSTIQFSSSISFEVDSSTVSVSNEAFVAGWVVFSTIKFLRQSLEKHRTPAFAVVLQSALDIALALRISKSQTAPNVVSPSKFMCNVDGGWLTHVHRSVLSWFVAVHRKFLSLTSAGSLQKYRRTLFQRAEACILADSELHMLFRRQCELLSTAELDDKAVRYLYKTLVLKWMHSREKHYLRVINSVNPDSGAVTLRGLLAASSVRQHSQLSDTEQEIFLLKPTGQLADTYPDDEVAVLEEESDFVDDELEL